jgi:phosphoribosyl 1,2-cyclic phosphate phosphodiesterase
MEILFLGTGSAWGVPEHSCNCSICTRMSELGEERSRTSFLIRDKESLLVDCGPDFRVQMRSNDLECPDAILITHEHGDHYLGLDDLLAFRRSMPADRWKPIPVYATVEAWESMEQRFGYLLGGLLEKRIATPSVPLEGIANKVVPFSTYHGPLVPGSVGYLIEGENLSGHPTTVLYTSDFVRIDDEPKFLENPDLVIMQAHWLNEPRENRPNHMSFQCSMDYLRRWNPEIATYLVHLSDADQVPGDPANAFMKKWDPLSPLADPVSGKPYAIPLCQSEWQDLADRICGEHNLPGPIRVPYDGQRITI